MNAMTEVTCLTERKMERDRSTAYEPLILVKEKLDENRSIQ